MIPFNFARVEGHEDLVRDLSTGAIHNLDRTALQHARAKKFSTLKDKARIATLESKVDQLIALVTKLTESKS